MLVLWGFDDCAGIGFGDAGFMGGKRGKAVSTDRSGWGCMARLVASFNG